MNVLHIKLDNDDIIQLECGKTIGSGAYGNVYVAKVCNGKWYGKSIALKKCSIKQKEVVFQKECELLARVNQESSKHIVQYYMHGRGSDGYLYLGTELCNGGELYDHIVKQQLTENMARNIMFQLLRAVQVLHTECNVVHRDIKPENILLTTLDGQQYCKLIDFGFASSAKKNTALETYLGTPYYIAPEILDKQYTRSCDIWSCGVVLYILLFGTPPFYHEKDSEILNKIKKRHYTFPNSHHELISEQAKDLVQHMLCPEETRWDIEQCLHHPWFEHYTYPIIADAQLQNHSSIDSIESDTINYEIDKSCSSVKQSQHYSKQVKHGIQHSMYFSKYQWFALFISFVSIFKLRKILKTFIKI